MTFTRYTLPTQAGSEMAKRTVPFFQYPCTVRYGNVRKMEYL